MRVSLRTCVPSIFKWCVLTVQWMLQVCLSARRNVHMRRTLPIRSGPVAPPACRRLWVLSTSPPFRACVRCKWLCQLRLTFQCDPVHCGTCSLLHTFLTYPSLIYFIHGVMAAPCALRPSTCFCLAWLTSPMHCKSHTRYLRPLCRRWCHGTLYRRCAS